MCTQRKALTSIISVEHWSFPLFFTLVCGLTLHITLVTPTIAASLEGGVCIVFLLTQLFKYISLYYLQNTVWFLIFFLPSDGVGPDPP